MSIDYKICDFTIDTFSFQKELYSEDVGFSMNHHLSFALIRERDMLKCAYTEEMFQGEADF